MVLRPQLMAVILALAGAVGGMIYLGQFKEAGTIASVVGMLGMRLIEKD